MQKVDHKTCSQKKNWKNVKLTYEIWFMPMRILWIAAEQAQQSSELQNAENISAHHKSSNTGEFM